VTMNAIPESVITTELLMQVFDMPVSFHRCLIPLTGGVTAALMLSHAIGTTQALDPAQGGWFLKSREEWKAQTGLSRWELETARRTLREAGFLEERRAGLPAKLYYRVCADQLWQALREEANRVSQLSRVTAAQAGGA
jgi:hypothetical protein